MKILVLGADGMLGHQLNESLAARHAIVGTVRRPAAAYAGVRGHLPENLHDDVDARDYEALRRVLELERPDAVINAIGIVKQRPESMHAIESLEINALLPHRLAVDCAALGARLVQISTDCVFSGRAGRYRETDAADAGDLYGRSKLLGEVADAGAVTLRTSIIGLELSRKSSLVEWFLAQRGALRGFRRAIYSGFTTLEMARIIEHVLMRHPDRHGVYHVASESITKFDLLEGLRRRLGRDICIEPDDDFACDRSLDGRRFENDFAYTPPSWDRMLDELAAQIKERYA
jgi:dTDP-4-dehydrorhamnose reductase